MQLDHRAMVITGATGRLGRFVAHRLAELEARLVLVATDADKLAELGKRLPNSYTDWLAVPVDLVQPDSADKVLQPAPANQSWTTPEEIFAALLYLCSDEARAVNGARIPLYGSD